ncbi:MAG: beta strand repeat-containing protein, partial [Planctomycetia bacterium]
NNSGANNVAITDTNAIDFGASALGSGTLTVTAVGITQSGAITQASSAGAATFNAGAGVITLTNAINDFTGAVSLNNSGTNNVGITDANAIDFGASLLGDGAFTVTAVGITQSGAIIQASSAGAVTINAGAGVITLTNAGNDFTGSVSLNNAGANNVAITDANLIDFGASTLGTGTLAIIAEYIIQSGAIAQASSAGIVTIDSGEGDICLTNVSNDFTGTVTLISNGHVAITDANLIDFGVSVLGTGSFTVNAVGITQSGAITQAAFAGTTTFNAGAGVITLTNASNDFAGTVSMNSTGSTVAITDVNSIDFGASTLGSGTLTVNAVGITQSNSIIQASSAGAVTFNAGTGVITLNDASNDFTGSVSLNNSGANHVAIADVNSIDFGASALGSGILSVIAVGITQTGAITQSSSAGIVTFDAGAGVITLTNAGNDFTGTVSLINTGANNVAVVDANNITLGFSNFGTGSFAVAASNIKLNSNVTTSNNSQTYTGNVVLAGNVVLDTTNNGTLPAGAAFTVLGSVTCDTMNYGLVIKGGTSGDVLVTGPIGMVGSGVAMGSLTIGGNDITLSDIDGVVGNSNISASDGNDIGSVTLSGSLYRTTGALEMSAGPRNSSNIVSNQLK